MWLYLRGTNLLVGERHLHILRPERRARTSRQQDKKRDEHFLGMVPSEDFCPEKIGMAGD